MVSVGHHDLQIHRAGQLPAGRGAAGRSGDEIIHAGNADPLSRKALAERRAEEASAPGDDSSLTGLGRRCGHRLVFLRIMFCLAVVPGADERIPLARACP